MATLTQTGEIVRPLGRMRALALPVRMAGLLGGYFLLEWWVLGVARLPESSYFQPVILGELIKAMLVPTAISPTAALRLAILAGLIVLLWIYRERLSAPWSRLEEDRYLRVLVAVIAGVLAWSYATYDYNAYFDRGHLVDRIVLVALALLVVWRPIAVLPFCLVSVSVIWQFWHPLGHFSVAEQFVLVRMLLLFTSAIFLGAIFARSWKREFLFVSIALLAAAYLRCGLGKATLDGASYGLFNWVTHGHIPFLLLATYGNGWLGFLDPGSVTQLALGVSRFDPLLVYGTMLLECGAIFCLVHRRALIGFLIGWIVFHLGVFALSGICFWKWMVVEGALLWIFLSPRRARAFPIFTRGHILISFLIIIAGTVWFRPVTLAWYDSPANYTYRFVGIGESGRKYSLSPSLFAPYDYQFTMGNFSYLSQEPILDITWGGIWSRELADRLVSAGAAREIEALEGERGRVHFDPEEAGRMDRFLTRFLGTLGRRESKRTPFSLARAIPQLWTFPRPDAYRGEEPITEVEIYQIASFFDGARYEEFRERMIRSVKLKG